ncbi:hypothetical protein [Pedobacter sp. Hv1]|uniref:hypothetical protein n=1 Tax=Pedobacter sp. Hv1 TaxID=1740090 RepID=UPI0006D8AFC1|nr:hypothetical protein [Pedobacter sp. Hv1]KQC00977.1 hypothetical protein AQF98_09915 [Pedobacter sp. Hv1]
MRYSLLIFCLFFLNAQLKAQNSFEAHFKALKTIAIDSGITLTIDEPAQFNTAKPTQLIVFALPNGNTTAQTFGKKLKDGDDWHFDIQHIGAQTAFIRNTDQHTNYIVVYAANNLKSWPAWRKKYEDSDLRIAKVVEYLANYYKNYKPKIMLSGHSGGGSFIFGYLNSQKQIPIAINCIGFLDATYGYESEKHQAKLKTWLKLKNTSLQVIAYNDSVVVFNGKPLVSPTGGTWYRSKLMAKELQTDFKLIHQELTDRLIWEDQRKRIAFCLIKNPEAKIYHTVLVEKNGFIALVFKGTRFETQQYQFWGDRAYQQYILQ